VKKVKEKFIQKKLKKKLRYSNPNRKEVGRFNSGGILICKYESIKEASKILECNVGHLSECCRGKRKMIKILGTDTLKYLTNEDK